MPVSITWARPLHAELCYHVLAHLDLGRDAASIHNPALESRTWVAPLLEAYHAAPGRLVAQVLPMVTPNVAGLFGRLRSGAIRGLDDPAGHELCRCLVDALDEQLPSVRERWHEATPAARARGEELLAWMVPLLQRLLRAVHAPNEASALSLLDCDALACAGGTHGRAAVAQGQHVVAVSLAGPREQVLCQVLHEELHVKTDPPIRATHDGDAQDTDHDSEGYRLHERLEQAAAVEVGQQLVEREAPELRAAYAVWRRRHGV